jgi:hypothetical protein
MWAVWHQDRLFFSTSPETVTARNLMLRPHVVVHPESASEVAVLHGSVARSDPRSLGRVVEAYESKYAWRLDSEDPGMPFFELTPRRALAWRAEDIQGSAARWDF